MRERPCLLCNPAIADSEMRRVEVWEDNLWRLTVSLFAEVLGFPSSNPSGTFPTSRILTGRRREHSVR